LIIFDHEKPHEILFVGILIIDKFKLRKEKGQGQVLENAKVYLWPVSRDWASYRPLLIQALGSYLPMGSQRPHQRIYPSQGRVKCNPFGTT